ncbi:MAG: S1C family serine protease [Rudaea sp.]
MKRSISGWLIAIVFLAIVVGIVGGGVMGAAAGYYVLQTHAAASTTGGVPVLTASQSPSQQQAPQAQSSASITTDSAVVNVVKKAEPAVVTVVATVQIQSRRANPFSPGGQTGLAEGSGFIIDQQGRIVTNAHVVDGASQLQVIYADGTKVSATLVGEDTNADVAVLKVSGKVPGTLSLANSSSLQPGESVIAIGSPLGSYEGSVTTGVVSGLNRSVDGSGLSGLIQTDAAINHGNSGGPLLNLSGQVVGINTLVIQNTNSGDIAEGLGFAIPSNTVSSVVQRILGGQSQ